MVLDILGQTPFLQIYTQITLVYSLDSSSSISHDKVVQTLTDGLSRLSSSFPWLAGRVVNTGARPGNTGVFRIRPLISDPQLIVQDLRGNTLAPTLGSLRQEGYSMSLLDEDILSPLRTIPGTLGSRPASEVFVVQSTFLDGGGILLTFVAQHNTMDMSGQGAVIRLLDKACRGETFTDHELRIGNMVRQDLIPLLDEKEWDDRGRGAVEPQVVKPVDTKGDAMPTPPAPPPCTWVYFDFSSTALTELKALATKTLPESSSTFISTNDALSAFVWQGISRARLPRFESAPTTSSTLMRAVNVRRQLGIAEDYPGILQTMAYNSLDIFSMVTLPLGHVASLLRSQLVDSDLAFRTRALATAMTRSPDRTLFSFTAGVDPGRDVMLSSWAAVKLNDLDFGLGLGKPEAVRRPRFAPFEGLVYLMPMDPHGGIAVGLCLRNEDLERLKIDVEFKRYAVYVG
jgi:hypothetical protein